MLVLTRKANEEIHIGNDIIIKVVATSSGRVKIGIDAPRDIDVMRGEVARSFEFSVKEDTTESEPELEDFAVA